VRDSVKRFMGRDRGFHIAESEAQHAFCNVKEKGSLEVSSYPFVVDAIRTLDKLLSFVVQSTKTGKSMRRFSSGSEKHHFH